MCGGRKLCSFRAALTSAVCGRRSYGYGFSPNVGVCISFRPPTMCSRYHPSSSEMIGRVVPLCRPVRRVWRENDFHHGEHGENAVFFEQLVTTGMSIFLVANWHLAWITKTLQSQQDCKSIPVIHENLEGAPVRLADSAMMSNCSLLYINRSVYVIWWAV